MNMFTGLVLIATSSLLSNLVLSRLNANSLQSTPIDLHNFSPTWGALKRLLNIFTYQLLKTSFEKEKMIRMISLYFEIASIDCILV